MLWSQLVREVCADCEFEPPASPEAIAEAEAALFLTLPADLCALWREANGVRDRYGWGVWSVQRMIEENLELRSYPEQNDLYMTFDSMLCFTEAGNGDLYFFPIQADGKINRPDIFLWKHETDSREWVAADLHRFVKSHLYKQGSH